MSDNNLKLKPEQELAINHENGNIMISASAGSGKTFVMIGRIVRLIKEKKTSVRNVLVLTFTESAASDMKRKLKEELEKAYKETGDRDLLEELDDVSTAEISTLHAFCLRLLRRNFYKAGISPDFKIASKEDVAELMSRAVEKLFREKYQQKDIEFNNFVKRYLKNREDKEIRAKVVEFYGKIQTEVDENVVFEKTLSNYTFEGYDKICNQVKNDYDEQFAYVEDNLIEIISAFSSTNYVKPLEFAKTLLSIVKEAKTLSFYDLEKLVDIDLSIKYRCKLEGVCENYNEKLKVNRDKIKNIFKSYKENFMPFKVDENYLKEQQRQAKIFIDLIKVFGGNYSSLKKEENLLDFNDLEHFALKVLNDSEVLSQLKEKYKYIAIDEYQDVNGVQEEILSRLENNNQFMVGDAKQSIYGFRGCNSIYFEKKFENMQKSGQNAIKLSYNFRCAPNVIDAINSVFDYCMTKKEYGIDYKNNAELIPGGVYEEGYNGRTKAYFLRKEKKSVKEDAKGIYSVLQNYKTEKLSNSDVIAGFISKIIDSELGKEYYDFKTKKVKTVGYSDIALLSRNKSTKYITDIINSLAKLGVPVVSEVSQNIAEFSEVRVLIDTLKLINCFIDDIPLATVMKSYVGKFTDEDLAKICLEYKTSDKKQKNWSFYNAFEYYVNEKTDDLSNRLKSFKDYFTSLRNYADFVGAKTLLNKIISDFNVEPILLASKNGLEKFRRVERFVSATESLDREYSVSEFLKKLKSSPDFITMPNIASSDSVKAMTIHASKGLEFPVVIVIGLEKNFSNASEKEEIYYDKDYGIIFKKFDDEKLISQNDFYRYFINNRIKKAKIKEETRLLYVALTRAQYSLCLALVGQEDTRKDKFTGAKSFIDMLPLSFPFEETSEDDLMVNLENRQTREVIIGKSDSALDESIKNSVFCIYPYLEDTRLPLKSSVTNVLSLENPLLKEESSKSVEVFEQETSGESAKIKGIIAHKIMENVDFSSLSDIDLQINNMLNKGIIKKEELSLIDVSGIKKALNNPIFSQIANKNLYREKSFLAYLPASVILDSSSQAKVTIQGIIDLLAIDEKGAQIIDYKYSSKDKNGLISQYKKQLDIYAMAVERVLKIKVYDKYICSLITGEVINVD